MYAAAFTTVRTVPHTKGAISQATLRVNSQPSGYIAFRKQIRSAVITFAFLIFFFLDITIIFEISNVIIFSISYNLSDYDHIFQSRI